MSRFGIIKINGVEHDLDDLTLDEVELLEEKAGGIPFSEINYGSAKGMKAFTFVLMKRDNPDLTDADIGAVKIVNFAVPDEEMPELPPDQAAEEESDDSPPAEPGALRSVASTTAG